MKRPQLARWLAPVYLVLAFQLNNHHTLYQVNAIQQASEQHNVGQEHQAGVQPSISLVSDSNSPMDSSAAIANDDLIAAESSQSPDAVEHKAFTSAQVLRQDPQQQVGGASVAPVYVPSQAQQQQQQQQHQHQQQQQQLYNVHPQHMMLQSRIPAHHQAGVGHPQPKSFNPFMAAALAGNYGPAQQQIAAAAAAALHGPRGGQMQHSVGPATHHFAHAHQMAHPHQQQPVRLAEQESSVRASAVPAPNYNNVVDSNSIELGSDLSSQAQASSQHPQALAVASSVQHPVIAASSPMQEQGAGAWPLQSPDIPKIVNLEVKCEKNLMKVSIEFDKLFNGVIFSKGHYSQGQCVHVSQNSGKQQAYFDISINSCGTQGNTQNGLYGMGGNTGSGTYFENTIVIQYDPNVQEVYDHARKLRCTWHDQYEKAVTFRPFPVDMLDIVRADFAGDNVGCWMQIQVGKGPWASEVAGIVKIGQTMTMVLAIKDEENKFDMLVRNCFAHDGKRGPIELVDKSGCITRPKLMSRFTKIKNFGSSATVLSYAHFQAFKFPDSMEVHFQCTIQICRHQCPEQCSAGPNAIGGSNSESYSESTISGTFNIHGSQSQAAGSDSGHLRKYGSSGLSRERRDLQHQYHNGSRPLTQQVGVNRMIQVVSTGDLAFAVQQQLQQVNGSLDGQAPLAEQLTRFDYGNQICMSSYNFVLSLVLLALILLCSTLTAISLYVRQRSLAKCSTSKLMVPSMGSSPASTLRQSRQVPTTRHHHQLMFEAS